LAMDYCLCELWLQNHPFIALLVVDDRRARRPLKEFAVIKAPRDLIFRSRGWS